jgi:S1-C subfamily serine protease
VFLVLSIILMAYGKDGSRLGAAVQLSFAPVVKATGTGGGQCPTRMVASREQGLFEDPFFRRFFGDDGSFGRPRERVQNSLGSGVIVDPSGIIVTTTM